MKYIFLALVYFILFLTNVYSQDKNNIVLRDYIKNVLNSREANDVTSYTFIQLTKKYDDSGNVSNTALWYEAVQYPDKFRIDFGSPKSGNTALFRDDKSYRFKNAVLDTVYQSPQSFLFIESGFYGYDNHEDIIDRFEELGYDSTKCYELENADIIVVGAEPGDESTKQLWIHKSNHYLVRSIDILSDNRLLDVKYSDFRNMDGFWVETKIDAFVNGRLVQTEIYRDIRTHVNFDKRFFDPNTLFMWHWYQE